PSAITGQILAKINRNESYPIVGRNEITSWWQINVNGIVGWVRASFVTSTNAQNVPVTSGGVPTAPTPIPAANCSSAPAPHMVIGKLARVIGGLPNNIRSLASATSPRIGQIPAGSTFLVLGGPQCVEGFYWWQINFNGIVGWTVEGFNGQYFVEPI